VAKRDDLAHCGRWTRQHPSSRFEPLQGLLELGTWRLLSHDRGITGGRCHVAWECAVPSWRQLCATAPLNNSRWSFAWPHLLRPSSGLICPIQNTVLCSATTRQRGVSNRVSSATRAPTPIRAGQRHRRPVLRLHLAERIVPTCAAVGAEGSKDGRAPCCKTNSATTGITRTGPAGSPPPNADKAVPYFDWSHPSASPLPDKN
jgi:hypothetical protein